MGKIVNVKQATTASKQLRSQEKKIVLVGGCFDILHIGHVKFLEKAKQKGNVLFVLLENDDNVRKLKGKNRPINNQKNRAIVLSSLTCVDYVLMLPNLKTNNEYDNIIYQIHPSVIATTSKDPSIVHKIRQAKQVNGKVVRVMQRVSDQSTTRLAKLIEGEI